MDMHKKYIHSPGPCGREGPPMYPHEALDSSKMYPSPVGQESMRMYPAPDYGHNDLDRLYINKHEIDNNRIYSQSHMVAKNSRQVFSRDDGYVQGYIENRQVQASKMMVDNCQVFSQHTDSKQLYCQQSATDSRQVFAQNKSESRQIYMLNAHESQHSPVFQSPVPVNQGYSRNPPAIENRQSSPSQGQGTVPHRQGLPLSQGHGRVPESQQSYSPQNLQENRALSNLAQRHFTERMFIQALQKSSHLRTEKDLEIIFAYLHGMEALSSLREPALRALCRTVRYEYHEANDILYCREELSTCWYILLSGSVFIEGSMFLPRSSFGKRSQGCSRRASECLILEPSEMIVIDYPDVQVMKNYQRPSVGNNVKVDRYFNDIDNQDNRMPKMEQENSVELPLEYGLRGDNNYQRQQDNYKRCSRASDTSSAYSGSDMMQSSLDDHEDMSGLQETLVDSDDEEAYNEFPEVSLVKDTVQECLHKEPSERTESDIDILLEHMQHYKAFANMTQPIMRALCSVMVYAVVPSKGTTVMRDKEELDSWSVILNGRVEIRHQDDSNVEYLYAGDSFGITPTMDKLYHQGEMKTCDNDCQFVCITQADYFRILKQGEENTKKHEEEGKVVMVTEHRIFDGGHRRGHIVIRGTPERLMQHLVEDHSSVDKTFVEDFLLCCRMFLDSPLMLLDRLLKWFEDPNKRKKVTKVVLHWVYRHFVDFENNSLMSEELERFEKLLEREKCREELKLLSRACSAKARNRAVTLNRATKDEVLHFSVLGGVERGCGIYISKVEKGSKAYEAGLKRGDQILEVNGNNFQSISHNRALEILRGATHLSLHIKSNLEDFKKMLNAEDRNSTDHLPIIPPLSKRLSVPDLEDYQIIKQKDQRKEKKDKTKFYTVGKRKNLMKMMGSLLPKNNSSSMEDSNEHLNRSDDSLYSGPSRTSTTSVSSLSPGMGSSLSASNPDLTLSGVDTAKEAPDTVIKVFRSDQSYKFLPINKETNAREVVMLALQDFGITDPSSNYSLYEVTVENENLVKQKRLSDLLNNLLERQTLNSRYYLKNNMNTEQLVPDDLRLDLIKEAQISLLQLHTIEVAMQLTLEDSKVFKDIEPSEYVDDLMQRETPNLKKFEELNNKEMFWVVTEICSECHIVRRAKLIKHFIKIAKHCKDCRNFNSMFAIMSGLCHTYVERLKATWEKVPNKYDKMFKDMKELLEVSHNFRKYRNVINNENTKPPMLPFIPVTKKDLLIIHIANDTYVDGLVNFEKIRMISKEVRHIEEMASVKYNANTMFQGFSNATENGIISGFATMKRVKNRRGSALPNAKKMYEEAEMARRVKAYLCNMKVYSDEEKLKDMSYVCEPPDKKPDTSHNFASTLSLTEDRKSVSSGPKFGSESEETIKKLMSLSDKVRPHNSSKQIIPSSLTSPMSGRRQPTSPRRPASQPILLSPESSSVVSLSNIARKSSYSGDSNSNHGSNDNVSQGKPVGVDSGRHSMSSNYDTQSVHSAGSNPSPSSQRRPSNLPQTVVTPPASHPNQNPLHPLLPPSQGSRPPLPPYHVVMQNAQNSPAYSTFIHQTYTNVRRPTLPDYASATQLNSRQKPLPRGMERSYSHDSYPREKTSFIVEYEDEEDEAQVSAV